MFRGWKTACADLMVKMGRNPNKGSQQAPPIFSLKDGFASHADAFGHSVLRQIGSVPDNSKLPGKAVAESAILYHFWTILTLYVGAF